MEILGKAWRVYEKIGDGKTRKRLDNRKKSKSLGKDWRVWKKRSENRKKLYSRKMLESGKRF